MIAKQMDENELGEILTTWLDNVVSRDFKKRQLKILGFLLMFMLRNKCLECYVPTLNSFEAIGITRSKIRYEIEKLEEANILSWERTNMIFKFNTDIENWKIETIAKGKSNRVQQILILNKVMYEPGPG